MKIKNKILSKINDYFDVRKYKKKIKNLEVKLELYSNISETNNILKKQHRRDKKKIKELKRIIEEDMIPKKKKKSN